MKRWIGASSAIAVVERAWEPNSTQDLFPGADAGADEIGTPYPDVVRRVREIAAMPLIALGRTVVVDLMRRAGMRCAVKPILIACGGRPGTGLPGGYESVSRPELLTGMQVLVQQGRLRQSEAHVLRQEMFGLRLAGKGTEAHDDLAIAVTLALLKARVGVVVEAERR